MKLMWIRLRARSATRWACVAVIWVAAMGGCSHEDPVQLIGVADGDYLRGVQISTFEVSVDRAVLGSDLLLDNLQIAEDELAPFELSWDTREFSEGKHRLTVRAYLDDGTFLTSTRSISIDNTLPVLSDVAKEVLLGRELPIDATDNGKIVRIEMSRSGTGEPPVVSETAPFELLWPWPCGPADVEVRVIDAAGGEVSGTFLVNGVDRDDADCDGHAAPPSGSDCDDHDATIYAGAPEYPGGRDRDCDGDVGAVPGDLDRDGVPGVAAGGDDCNDADPTFHGSFFSLGRQPLFMNGKPIRWNPGEAAIQEGFGPWQLALNRAGVVEYINTRADGALAVERLARDANPASIALSGVYVAFGRGDQVIVMRLENGRWWVEDVPIPAHGPVGKISIQMFTSDNRYAAFQAANEVWFAAWNGSSWTSRLLADVGAPLVEAPNLSVGFAEVNSSVAFRTATAAWLARRRVPATSFTTEPLGPQGTIPTALAGIGGSMFLAVEQGEGSAIVAASLPTPLTFPQRITGLVTHLPHLFVKLEGQELRVVRLPSGRTTQTIPDVGAFDTVSFLSLAGDGNVYNPLDGIVSDAPDARGDGVDHDCDGFD